jgi:WD40 repeat protein
VVTLGQAPVPLFADAGRRVAAINSGDADEDPTLTADLLQIYFSSRRPGGRGDADIWHAARASRADAFDAPALVEAVNSEDDELSPVISPDGLTLWVASNRASGAGNVDVWRSTRSSRTLEDWSPLENETALNSPEDDLPRPLAQAGLVMPIASRRDGPLYQTYLASRPAAHAPFVAVRPLTLLSQEDAQMEDAFLTEDGLLLFFNRQAQAGQGDLFMTWRASLDQEFRDLVPLVTVNTAADERDPWLSADGLRLFFSSDRRPSTRLDIYATSVELPRFE